jgi:hypothetical protein
MAVQNPGGAAEPAVGDPARSIVVVVPFTSDPYSKIQNPGPRKFYDPKGKRNSVPPGNKWNPTWKLQLEHQFGITNFLEAIPVERYGEYTKSPELGHTYESDVVAKHTQYVTAKKNKKAPSPNLLYEAVTSALQHGMPAEAYQYANELLAETKENKDAILSDAAKRFLKVYEGLQPKLAAQAQKLDDLELWQSRIELIAPNTRMLKSGHYFMFYWGDDKEARRRADQLNDNLRAFFLWHATRGVTLDVPSKPLVAVVIPDANMMRKMAQPVMDVPERAAAMGTPRGGEMARAPDGWHLLDLGFYAPDHELLVLSPNRGDSVAITFRSQNAINVYNNMPRDRLLAGGGPPFPAVENPMMDDLKPDEHPEVVETARKQTLAMIDRYMQRDAEIAGVSREGSRQLFYETGLLPRHVALPQWLQTGAAHYFHRPIGPVFTPSDDGSPPVMTVALTTGYGRPNFIMQKHFKDMPTRKELTTDAQTLLRNVLTDTYFRAMTGGFELDAPPAAGPKTATTPTPAPGGPMAAPAQPEEDFYAELRAKEERMSMKAQATAWALFYYLYTEKPEEYRKYITELDKLPRDLPVDEKTALDVFGRAFNVSMGPTPEPGKTSFEDFAKTWQEKVQGTTPAGVEVRIKPPPPPDSLPMPNPGVQPRPVGPRSSG